MKDIYRQKRGRVVLQWVATLDRECCLCCGLLDGKEFREGEIPHPFHDGCRCIVMPQEKSWKEMGIDGIPELVPTVRAARDERGKSVVVPCVSYEEWFLGLRHTYQVAILGAERYKVWRSRRLRFRDLVVFKGEIPLREKTIDELASMLKAD